MTVPDGACPICGHTPCTAAWPREGQRTTSAAAGTSGTKRPGRGTKPRVSPTHTATRPGRTYTL